jgi:hypothetical protein
MTAMSTVLPDSWAMAVPVKQVSGVLTVTRRDVVSVRAAYQGKLLQTTRTVVPCRCSVSVVPAGIGFVSLHEYVEALLPTLAPPPPRQDAVVPTASSTPTNFMRLRRFLSQSGS